MANPSLFQPSLDLSTDTGVIKAAAQSDGHPVTITSLQTESLAVLAIMYYLRVLSKHYSIPLSESYIQYFFDNEEILRRLDTQASFSDIANPHSTDYDVWSALKEASIETPGNHFGTHVKGHQNESVLLENLSIESQLDVRMDETAGLCRVSHTIPLKARTHKGTNITLTINGDIITSNLHSALRFGKTAHTLQNYIMQEQGWDIYIFEMVDWPNFGKYLSSLPFVIASERN